MVDNRRTVVREVGDESVAAGRGPGQLPWYEYAVRYVKGKSVLDVGCGLGKGLEILRSQARLAHGQDLDSRLASDLIKIKDLGEFEDSSYDVVTTIDVVEHVKDPAEFLRQCARVAREGVLITTPNWTASRCQWPYHLREYTPSEFFELVSTVGTAHLLKGTSNGSHVYPVRHLRAYFLFNDLRNWLPTALLARCWNQVLPRRMRIQSSNAAWIEVGPKPQSH